jgi:hypothetical protein
MDTWLAYDIAAEEKGIAPMSLVRRLLTIIAEDGLINAILDDDKPDARREVGEQPEV